MKKSAVDLYVEALFAKSGVKTITKEQRAELDSQRAETQARLVPEGFVEYKPNQRF